MAEQLSRKSSAEYRKSVFIKQIASEIEETEANISGLSQKVKSGAEYRPVECTINYNWKTGRRAWFRTDNGEQVKDAGISNEDMQEYLELNPPDKEREPAFEYNEEIEETPYGTR
jgi:hypothetical protein